MRHNWGVPSPGPTNMGLNLSLWASKWPLHLQMVKNANTNTADQMVFKPVDARNPFPALFVFYLLPNKELFSLSLEVYFFGPSYPTFVEVAYKPNFFWNYIFCGSLNMEKLLNEDGPCFLFCDQICGKSGGNLVRAFTAPRTIESDTRKWLPTVDNRLQWTRIWKNNRSR